MKDFVTAVEDKAAKNWLHHGVSQGQRGKTPTSRSNKEVEAITMHAPTCNFRGTPMSVNLAYVPYITLC